MPGFKLSILIPSTFDRRDMTNKLVIYLYEQDIGMKMPFEINVEFDDREMSIGAKRQKMIEESKGEYVVFIDSDDWVAPDYISSIMEAIEQNPDTIGFRIKCEGTIGKTACASLKYPIWGEKIDGFYYVRSPYHKTPIKREIALQIGYNDMRFAEDADYSKRLMDSGLLKSEVFIYKELYIYRFKYQDPKIKYGLNKK